MSQLARNDGVANLATLLPDLAHFSSIPVEKLILSI